MPLKINCLIENRNIQKDLRDIVEVIGYDLAGNTGSAKIEQVYSAVRAAGMELDIQTLSHIYADVFDLTDDTFSSVNDIDKARQSTYRQLATLQAKVNNATIGKDKPSVAAASAVIKSLVTNITNKSQQRIMQDRLIKAAKRILGVKRSVNKADLGELVEEILSTENPGVFNGMGPMENAERLFDEMIEELETEGLTYNNAQMVQFANIMRNATYDVLAGKGEINRLVVDTLKENGFTKQINVINQCP